MLAHVGAYSAYATPGRVNQFNAARDNASHSRPGAKRNYVPALSLNLLQEAAKGGA